MPKQTASALEKQRKQFGDWLRKHRKARDLNQAQAAELAGISRTQWIRLEAGESGTRAENVPRIAAAIGADLDETYRRAGYEMFVGAAEKGGYQERLGALPPSVQSDVATMFDAVIDALWHKYGVTAEGGTAKA